MNNFLSFFHIKLKEAKKSHVHVHHRHVERQLVHGLLPGNLHVSERAYSSALISFLY